jgi:hypothetical protein
MENATVRGVSSLDLFDRAKLSNQIRGTGSIPQGGVRTIHIDSSQCGSERSDVNSLVCSQIIDRPDQSRELWIVDIDHDIDRRWKPDELPRRIVSFLEKWSPYSRATAEQIIGSGFLKALLAVEWQRQNLKPHKLIWIPQRSQASKAARISRLVRIHQEDRLRLVANHRWNDEFLEQAERWTGASRNRGRL